MDKNKNIFFTKGRKCVSYRSQFCLPVLWCCNSPPLSQVAAVVSKIFKTKIDDFPWQLLWKYQPWLWIFPLISIYNSIQSKFLAPTSIVHIILFLTAHPTCSVRIWLESLYNISHFILLHSMPNINFKCHCRFSPNVSAPPSCCLLCLWTNIFTWPQSLCLSNPFQYQFLLSRLHKNSWLMMACIQEWVIFISREAFWDDWINFLLIHEPHADCKRFGAGTIFFGLCVCSWQYNEILALWVGILGTDKTTIAWTRTTAQVVRNLSSLYI